MVLSVNAWMNNPSGFRLEDGRAVDVEPVAALFGNSYLWPELTHMYVAGYIVAGFLVAGPYAWSWLRGRRTSYVRVALAIPLTAAALAAPVQIVVGDWLARQVAEDQPTKLASFEGLSKTERGASLHIGGWYDEDTGEIDFGIGIPDLLSLLAYHDPNAKVQGLDAVPERDQPPINVVRLTFQAMVGIGFFMAAVGLVHLYRLARRRGPPRSKWFYRAVMAAGPLSVVALICGWVTTEVGRQPWVVYGVMRTEEAVTGADGVPVGYATLALVYVGLIAATLVDPAASVAGTARGGVWMSLAEAPIVLTLVGLAAYTVLGGADFGAGLWFFVTGRGRDQEEVREHTFHAMAPVWEANHVWLIFVLVVCWTAYPVAFGSLFSTLAVPLFIAAVGHHHARHRLRASQRQPVAAAGQRDRRGLLAVVGAHAVRARRGGGGHRLGPGPRRERERRPLLELAQPHVPADRRDRRRHLGVHGGGVPRGGRRAAGRAGDDRGVSPPRVRRRASWPGRWRSAASPC